MVRDSSKGKKVYYGWVVVATSFVIFAVSFGIQYSFGIFFKPLQDTFGWSRATTSWAMTTHLIVYGLSMLPVGWLFDRFKTGPLFSIAAVMLGSSLVLCSRISQPWQLYLLYGLPLGMAISLCGPTIMTLVTRWFVEKRGIALGIAAAGSGFGTLVGAPISNSLIDAYGWRNAFVIIGIAGCIIILLCAYFLRSIPQPGKESRSAVVRADKTSLPAGLPPYRGVSIVQAIMTRDLCLLMMTNFCFSFALRMIMVHVAPHAIDKGISPSMAALAIGTIGGASIFGRLVMGFFQDKIGTRRSMIICLITQAVSMVVVPFIRADLLFFGFAVVFGFVYGGDVPQFPAITAELFGLGSIGVIYGLVVAVGNAGGALGPILAGYVFDLTGSYTIIFLIGAACLFGGVFCVSQLSRPGEGARVLA